MQLRAPLCAVLLAAAGSLMADVGGPVQVRLETSARDGQVTFVPRLDAPAGARLRYEVVASKDGPAGRTSSNQSGEVAVGAGGSAPLSTLALGLGPDDRCTISVRIYEGTRLIAERVFQHPQ